MGCSGATAPDAGTDAGRLPVDAPASMVRMLPLTVLETIGAGMTRPLAGAVVALDQAGVARREERADDQGRVAFMVDWALGPVDVTGYAEDHGLVSRVGWLEDDFDEHQMAGRPVMVLGNWDTEGIEISGTISNKVGTETRVYVSATTPNNDTFDDVGPAYSLYTWPRADFGLVALEYEYTVFDASRVRQTVHRWAATPRHTPLGAPERIDIDLVAQAVTPTITTATFRLPLTPFFDDPTRYLYVTETDPAGNQVLGVATSIDVSLDGVASYTMEAVEADGVPTRFTTYAIATDTGYSSVQLAGGSLTGAQTLTWMEPPSYATPGVVPRTGEVAIDGAIEAARTAMWIYDDAGTTWNVLGPRGGTALHLPALPSGAPAELYTPTGARVGLYLCAAFDPIAGACRSRSWGEDRPLGS